MDVLNINGKRAVRIKGKKLNPETMKSYLIDCDGVARWFPMDSVRFNNDGTVDIQLWVYLMKTRFPN